MANEIVVGDYIEHNLLPGVAMEVLAMEPCEEDNHGQHQQFKVIDPEGSEDWLCARSVEKV